MGTRRGTPVSLLLFIVGLGVLFLLLGGGGVLATDGGDTAQVSANNTANVTLYYAETAEFPNVTALEAGIEEGEVKQAERMLIGETLVIEIESERLAADLEAGNGSTTERFFDVLAEDADLGILQHPETVDPHYAPWELHPDPAHVTVYRTRNTTYVTVPLDSAGEDGEEATFEIRDGDRRISTAHPRRFVVAFSYEVAFGPGEDEELWLSPDDHPSMELHPKPILTFDPPLNYPSWSLVGPDVVTGTGRFAITRNFTARAVFDDGITINTTVTPTPDSEIVEFDLDFRDAGPGSSFTLELLHDGTVFEQHNGTVQEPSASLSKPQVRAVGDDDESFLLQVTAFLSHGGAVDVVDETGESLTVVEVEPGEQADRSIQLPDEELRERQPSELRVRALQGVTYERIPYDAENATRTVDVSARDWGADTPTATPSATATPTPTPTPEPDSTPTDVTPTPTEATPSTQADPTATVPGTETVADDDGTGFGVLAALAAPVICVGLGRRGGE